MSHFNEERPDVLFNIIITFVLILIISILVFWKNTYRYPLYLINTDEVVEKIIDDINNTEVTKFSWRDDEYDIKNERIFLSSRVDFWKKEYRLWHISQLSFIKREIIIYAFNKRVKEFEENEEKKIRNNAIEYINSIYK